EALRDPTEAPRHGIVTGVSESDRFLQSRPVEPANRCPPHGVSALPPDAPGRRRRSELRCPEPRAQLGKDHGLLRRSASVPRSVAPRKQASAARSVLSSCFLEQESHMECSGPKFPWDSVRGQPAPGTLTHRRMPKLYKRLRQTQTGLRVLGKDD